MLRLAAPADLLRLLAIRDSAGADALSNPARIDAAELGRLVVAASVAAWEESCVVEGFVAVDEDNGDILGLLVSAGARGKGVGRALLAAACDRLTRAGHRVARLAVIAGSDAERHYRAAGWSDAGCRSADSLVLKKPL